MGCYNCNHDTFSLKVVKCRVVSGVFGRDPRLIPINGDASEFVVLGECDSCGKLYSFKELRTMAEEVEIEKERLDSV